ncbi:hypothetical protein [uncultured Psychroserpens sp.]|uniref:hypothetical protein n=1 Tax=uncultured Psychroserpens sp. TaxID=255436 RepID=UPI002602375B|nr:hypothetical protein [uncultured Psychroserpens sp.]
MKVLYLLLVVLLCSSCKGDTMSPLSSYLSTIGKTPIKFEADNITTSTRDSDNPEVFDGHLDIYIVRFDIEDWK